MLTSSNFKGKKTKKLLFQLVFSTYLFVFLFKFLSRELVGCGIQFLIQRIPTRHIFCGSRSMKNEKYKKTRDADINITFFHVFLVFCGARSTKSMPSGYSLDEELNSPSNEWSWSKFEKNLKEISWKYELKK